jgi:hypothetical protein
MGCVVNATPDRFTPGKDPIPFVQEAGWAPGLVWTGKENLPSPPEFDPGTVQHVASRYTDWAIPAHGLKHVAVYSVDTEMLKNLVS